MGEVIPVVVTFNRLAKLKRVLASISEQSMPPSRIVVVNNSSTDGTGDFLSSYLGDVPLEVLTLPTNEGGAGGFYAGMRRAYDLGADYVWLMDDDGYPKPNALENLRLGLDTAAKELGYQVSFACSVVQFTDGNICEMNNPTPTWDWGRLLAKGAPLVLVSSCSFVSVLISRSMMERHGLPFREYFIWFDDAEYTMRLSNDAPGIQVLNSEIVHDMGENKGVNFGMIDDHNIWKFEFGVRNQASFRLHHQSFAHYLFFVLQVTAGMRRGRVRGALQRRIYRKLMNAITFNPKIEFPQSAH